MNSTLIESVGISHLKIFLSKAKIILPAINQMEKYPMWDGELLLYRNERMLNDDLICRVPVQVKSEKSDKLESDITTYSVEKEHLIKYADEGGVLFIKVVYNENGDSKVYMNLLLKSDIIELLNKSKPTSTTKSITIPAINDVKEVITHCQNFNIHSKLQAQMPQNLDFSSIKEQLEIVSYSHINDIRDLVTKDQYAYAKLSYNMHAYIGKFRNQKLSGMINIFAGTESKKYHDHITDVITASDRYIEVGKYVKVYDKQLVIANNLQDDNILNTINDLEFVLDILENKNLKIGDKTIHLNFDSDKNIDDKIRTTREQILYFKDALDVIKLLHLDINKANIDSVMKDEKEICSIRNIINGQRIIFSDKECDKFVNSTDVLNQKYLIYFVKNADGTYDGYDFLNNDIVLNYLIVHEVTDVQLSRYYNLKADILVDSNIDENKIIKEIQKSTKNEYTMTYITVLLLEFIKCYDLSGDIKFLNIAERINKLIMNEPLYSIDYYNINKYQMLKRKRLLSRQEKKEITMIKVNNPDNLYTICSCCLLCDQYEEFEEYFEKLNNEEQEIYKSWSIYYFYEKYLKELGESS